MLATIGVSSVDALFETIPADVQLKELLDIPGPCRADEPGSRQAHGWAMSVMSRAAPVAADVAIAA